MKVLKILILATVISAQAEQGLESNTVFPLESMTQEVRKSLGFFGGVVKPTDSVEQGSNVGFRFGLQPQEYIDMGMEASTTFDLEARNQSDHRHSFWLFDLKYSPFARARFFNFGFALGPVFESVSNQTQAKFGTRLSVGAFLPMRGQIYSRGSIGLGVQFGYLGVIDNFNAMSAIAILSYWL